MDVFPWVIITLVILGVVVGIAMIFFLIRRGEPSKMAGSAYLTFFIVGISYLSLGISLSFVLPQDTELFNFFTFMGIIFTAMGLSNIDKWRKKPD